MPKNSVVARALQTNRLATLSVLSVLAGLLSVAWMLAPAAAHVVENPAFPEKPPHTVPVNNGEEENDQPSVWQQATETLLDPEADVRDRSNAMRRLLEGGAEEAEPRRLVARRLLEASQPREDLVRILDELAYYAEDDSFRQHFHPEYFFSLLLIAGREEQGEEQEELTLRERSLSILAAGYSAEARRARLLEALALDASASIRNTQVQRAAIRAMSETKLATLSTQLDAFCPALIEMINEEPPPSDETLARVQASLRAITEYRGASSPPHWRDWWQRKMAELSSLERVEVVVENVRRHRSALERELSVLQIAEQQRAVEENAGNFEELMRFVSPERYPEVVLTALEHLQEWLESRDANDEQEEALMSRLTTGFASDVAEVRTAIAHTAILLGPAGEEVVAARTPQEQIPSSKAAMIALLARHGSASNSLEIVLDVIKRRDQVAPEVLLAAIRNLPRWESFDQQAEAATLETLAEFTNGLHPRHDRGLAVELHNALNELSPRLDITPVIQELLHSPAASGSSAMSLQLQLAVVHQALNGPSRERLQAFLRGYERETHFFYHVLARAEPSRFELRRSLEILAELEDPLLDLEREGTREAHNGNEGPPTLYAAIARHYEAEGRNGAVREAIAAAFRAFALQEIERFEGEGEPPLEVPTRMMELGLASLARSDTLPALRAADEELAERHRDAFERLDARLGIRMVTALSEAMPTYAQLVREERMPREVQHADLNFALAPGSAQEVEFRLLVLPRLLLALHPQGPSVPVDHVWQHLAQRLSQRLTGERPQAPQHVLRAARALYEHSDELRRLLAIEGNRPLEHFHDTLADARRMLQSWQSERWQTLSARLHKDEPVPGEVRRFVRDGRVGLPAVGTRFQEVPSNTQVAMPGLVERLHDLEHGDRLARSLWSLIHEAAAEEGYQLATNWPDEAQAFESAREALTEELHRLGYNVPASD